MTMCFLSRATELFGLHCESLTSTQKFRISPRVSYTHKEILDISPGLLYTQKFWISPRVSYTHIEIRDTSLGLLHPHRNSVYLPRSLTPTQNFRYLHGSLTPTQKFRISPRVSYTHTGPFRYYRGSPSPKLQAFSPEGINGSLLALPNTH